MEAHPIDAPVGVTFFKKTQGIHLFQSNLVYNLGKILHNLNRGFLSSISILARS